MMVMMMMMVMVMMMMMMIMLMIMIMAIVSVEQRPGWGEHVLIGERTAKIRTFWKWLKRLTLPHARCTSFGLDAVLQPICCVFNFHPVWIKLGCV